MKASLIREELFEWFCTIKRAVETRIPAGVVLERARHLLGVYVTECAKRGMRADGPRVKYSWLLSWRLEYGVSLRQPSRRFMAPKEI